MSSIGIHAYVRDRAHGGGGGPGDGPRNAVKITKGKTFQLLLFYFVYESYHIPYDICAQRVIVPTNQTFQIPVGVTSYIHHQFHLKFGSGSLYHLQRLSLMHTLDSHRGCVNTVAWNEAGTLLLSGSDDRRLIVTDPFSR